MNVLIFSCSNLENLSNDLLTPRIAVRDRGNSPNSATCEISVRLFNLAETVDIYFIGEVNDFRPDIFGELISNILELNIEITEFSQFNETHYFTRIYGQSEGVILEASAIVDRLASLSQADMIRLSNAGFEIAIFTSNAPTESPTTFIPTRQIPIWAVAVIVVVNSVIIISALLLIVGILWRRYRRLVMHADEELFCRQYTLKIFLVIISSS